MMVPWVFPPPVPAAYLTSLPSRRQCLRPVTKCSLRDYVADRAREYVQPFVTSSALNINTKLCARANYSAYRILYVLIPVCQRVRAMKSPPLLLPPPRLSEITYIPFSMHWAFLLIYYHYYLGEGDNSVV